MTLAEQLESNSEQGGILKIHQDSPCSITRQLTTNNLKQLSSYLPALSGMRWIIRLVIVFLALSLSIDGLPAKRGAFVSFYT